MYLCINNNVNIIKKFIKYYRIMENNNKKLYSKSEYAVLKSKFPSQITKWVKEKKLKMEACEDTAKFYILDCEENDNFINNLSVGRYKKEEE